VPFPAATRGTGKVAEKPGGRASSGTGDGDNASSKAAKTPRPARLPSIPDRLRPLSGRLRRGRRWERRRKKTINQKNHVPGPDSDVRPRLGGGHRQFHRGPGDQRRLCGGLETVSGKSGTTIVSRCSRTWRARDPEAKPLDCTAQRRSSAKIAADWGGLRVLLECTMIERSTAEGMNTPHSASGRAGLPFARASARSRCWR